MYPKVLNKIPAQPAATDQALAPPSGKDGCPGSSDLDPASCSTGSSEGLLCSLRDVGVDVTPEDMNKSSSN